MDSSKVIQLVAGASVQGVPLIVVVLGLVEYAKRWGFQGKQLLGASMGVGLVLGAAYQGYVLASAPGPGPATAAAWYIAVFGMVIYGLVLGLVASGVYDFADGIVTQAVARLKTPTTITMEPPKPPKDYLTTVKGSAGSRSHKPPTPPAQ